MHHNFIDRYSDLHSPVHNLAASVKLCSALMLLVFSLCVPSGRLVEFGLYWGVLLAVLAVSRVPVAYVMMRLLAIMLIVLITTLPVPFSKSGAVVWEGNVIIPLVISREGLVLFVNILLKASVCVLTVILLTATTSFNEILYTLHRWKIPGVVVMLLSFMYRYIFLFVDQAERMLNAKKSRGFGLRGWKLWKTVGHMAAAMFLRAFERSERVFQAMCARGFDGTVRIISAKTFSLNSLVALLLISGTLILCKLLGVLVGV